MLKNMQNYLLSVHIRANNLTLRGVTMKAEDVSDDLESVLLSREEIDEIVQNLAAKIDRDYAGKEVLLVGVLKGALMIMADLSRAMKTHVTVDFMAVSSYGSGTKSSGVVRIIKDLEEDLRHRHGRIVEAIVDSGLTRCLRQTDGKSGVEGQRGRR